MLSTNIKFSKLKCLFYKDYQKLNIHFYFHQLQTYTGNTIPLQVNIIPLHVNTIPFKLKERKTM